MTLEQLILLAIVQGITEFLPVSSSGHLSLVHQLTDWPDQGVLMDVAVHAGTLAAVLAYFRHDVWRMIVGTFNLARGRVTDDGKLALYLILATLPVVVIGFALLRSGFVDLMRTAEVIAWANLFFAALLYATDRIGLTVNRLEHLGWGSALMIGAAQVLALIPGASRAGVTISMARILGFERSDAARFSMLLSIPTILGAAAASTWQVVESGDVALGYDMGLAALLAFGVAVLSIHLFLKLLERTTMLPFVIYRVAVGALLLGWIYFA